MTSHDVTEEHLDRVGDDPVPSIDVERLAAALRWAIGRVPRQADQAADRALLRDLVHRLDPGADPNPAALDARLLEVLAEVAARDELADHAAPRHRSWIGDVGRIYLCAPEDLPAELQDRIGSETLLDHLADGVSNRARAAARILDLHPNAVRVRREPLVLRAAAAALVSRAPDLPAPSRAEPPRAVAPTPRPGPGVVRTVLVGLAVAAAAVVVAATILVTRRADRPEAATPQGPPTLTTIVPLPAPPSVLGLVDGELVAIADGAVHGLGLDAVAADAVRVDDVVHVAVERPDGGVAYGTVGTDPGRWVDLGAGTDPVVGLSRDGRPVVVAVRGPDGDLARRDIASDGRPAEQWQRLSGTAAIDIDMAVNRDGRLEVGALSDDGTAFNVWQTGAPGGWSNYADPRTGTDGRRIQVVSNLDGRLELYVERGDGGLWNTWQEAPGRSWHAGWDTRYLTDLRQWRVAVGTDGRLVVAALTDEGLILRRQVPVPQSDGTTKLMFPPSPTFDRLDPLDGPAADTVTAVTEGDEVLVVVSGAGRTVGVPVGADGPEAPRTLARSAVDLLVPIDG